MILKKCSVIFYSSYCFCVHLPFLFSEFVKPTVSLLKSTAFPWSSSIRNVVISIKLLVSFLYYLIFGLPISLWPRAVLLQHYGNFSSNTLYYTSRHIKTLRMKFINYSKTNDFSTFYVPLVYSFFCWESFISFWRKELSSKFNSVRFGLPKIVIIVFIVVLSASTGLKHWDASLFFLQPPSGSDQYRVFD